MSISLNAKIQLTTFSKRYEGKTPYKLTYIDSICINPIYLQELEEAGLIIVDRITKPTPLPQELMDLAEKMNKMMENK
jgi:hypothetical protein